MKYEELITNKILDLLGLDRKSSGSTQALGVLGLIGLGVVAGAAIALLVAPSPGAQLRQEVARRLGIKESDLDGQALDELIT
jgi:gas vesicle protein